MKQTTANNYVKDLHIYHFEVDFLLMQTNIQYLTILELFNTILF